MKSNFLSTAPALPGGRRRSRGLFLDRWGTLLELPGESFGFRADELQFIPGAIDALFRAHRVLVADEVQVPAGAVAEGRQSDASWGRMQEAITEELSSLGVRLRRFYACLDSPGGRGVHLSLIHI